MGSRRETWHYGLVARWWAEFNTDGDDIAWFQQLVEMSGEPVLDLGCGTGRLLVPWLRARLDVDGCDVSGDMLARCRERAEAEGLRVRLYEQAMHELELPRRYRTVVICGSFGLGADRGQDQEALRRVRAHLEPGGVLILDNHLPSPREWRSWFPERPGKLPTPWPERGERKRAADGSELEIKMRVLAFDPLEQTLRRELRVELWRDGELVGAEERSLDSNVYFKNELVLMLEHAGFGDVEVKAGLTHDRPRAHGDPRLVFVAQR